MFLRSNADNSAINLPTSICRTRRTESCTSDSAMQGKKHILRPSHRLEKPPSCFRQPVERTRSRLPRLNDSFFSGPMPTLAPARASARVANAVCPSQISKLQSAFQDFQAATPVALYDKSRQISSPGEIVIIPSSATRTSTSSGLDSGGRVRVVVSRPPRKQSSRLQHHLLLIIKQQSAFHSLPSFSQGQPDRSPPSPQ
jgi:hypothetical protein